MLCSIELYTVKQYTVLHYIHNQHSKLDYIVLQQDNITWSIVILCWVKHAVSNVMRHS